MTVAILTKEVFKGAHWYTVDGRAAHRQPTKDGSGERATTIADARRLGLLPSVTSVLGMLAKPQLDEWKLNQLVIAAHANPIQPNESVDYWGKRIKAASRESVDDAADLGGRIHHALERMFDGEPIPSELLIYIQPVAEWLDRTGLQITHRELILINEQEGYGGASDVMFTWGDATGKGILDYKTRKTYPGKPVTPYDGQAMQLAAYAATFYGRESLPQVLAANVYISSTEPGRVEVCKHGDLADHYDAFLACCRLWRYQRGYDPRQQQALPV